MRFVIGAVGDLEQLCDLDVLVDTRLLVQANSGAGKSWCLRRILEQTFGQVQHLVIDPEGEFASLRERFDYVLAARTGGDTAADPRSAKLLAHRLLELGASAILDIYELKAHERVRFVRLFLEALVDAPKSLWHPALVVVDESHVFCPQRGEAESASAVIDLATRGRKRGFAAVLATQRLSKLHKDAAAECNNKLIGRSALDIDMRRASEELGFVGREEQQTLRDLEPGEFYAFGPALSRTVARVKVGGVQTTHPKAGARLAFKAPPPTEKVRGLLPRLADLPAEAEEQVRTADAMRREIADLKRRLTLASREGPVVDETAIEKRVKAAVAVAAREQEVAIRRVSREAERLEGVLRQTAGLLTQQAERILSGLGKLAEPSEALAPARPAPISAPPQPSLARSPGPAPFSNQEGALSRPQQRILDVLAAFEPLGISQVHKNMVAVHACASPTSGGYFNNLGRLRSLGLVDYPQPSYVSLTPGGREAAGPVEPITGVAELHESWCRILPRAQSAILRALIEMYPEAVQKDDLAVQLGVSPTSGGYFNNLGRLRTLGAIEYPGRGMVKAADILWPEGLS